MKTFHFLGLGTAHEEYNRACEDSLYYTKVYDKHHKNKYIYAISDGCSSSKYAAEASRCNVHTVKKIFSKLDIADLNRTSLIRLYPNLKSELTKLKTIESYFQLIFEYEMAYLSKQLRIKDAELKDFCATLLFVIVEEEHTLMAHIGDGNIIFFSNNGKVILRSEEDNDTDAYHTYFTLSPDFDEHFKIGTIPTNSYDSFMLFSDGLQTMFRCEGDSIVRGAQKIVLKPIMKKEVTTNYELAQRLHQSMFTYDYCLDDWSLIVACKKHNNSEIMKPVSLEQMFYEGIDIDNIQYEDNKVIKNKETLDEALKKEGNVNALCERLKIKLSHMIHKFTIKKNKTKN